MDRRMCSSILVFYSLSTSSVSISLSCDDQECLQTWPVSAALVKPPLAEKHCLGGEKWDGSGGWWTISCWQGPGLWITINSKVLV